MERSEGLRAWGIARRKREDVMDIKTFDAIARQVAAVSRRGTIRALGGAAMAAGLAAPTVIRAGEAGKNGRKRCKRQRGQCLAFFAEFCEPKDDPAGCLEEVRPCCEHFARCNAGAGIECLFETILA
jgi:hypothetical protein